VGARLVGANVETVGFGVGGFTGATVGAAVGAVVGPDVGSTVGLDEGGGVGKLLMFKKSYFIALIMNTCIITLTHHNSEYETVFQ